MPERLKRLHQVVDELEININQLEADLIDKKEPDVIILQLQSMNDLIAKFQDELTQIKEKFHNRRVDS